jgi:hypothetical protein
MADKERDDSAFVGHEPCPECGSRDNAARYASGRLWCHGCQKTIEWPDDGQEHRPRRASSKNTMTESYEPYPSDLGGRSAHLCLWAIYGDPPGLRHRPGPNGRRAPRRYLSAQGLHYPGFPDETLWGREEDTIIGAVLIQRHHYMECERYSDKSLKDRILLITILSGRIFFDVISFILITDINESSIGSFQQIFIDPFSETPKVMYFSRFLVDV